MNYWILCLPREDIDRCIKIGVFGLERRNVIAKVAEGDKIVCCAGKGDWKILAVGLATTDYYVDIEKVFLKPGVFPDRFNFTAQKLPAEIDVLPLLPKLSFVTNINYWAVFFRNGIAKMSEQDWELIANPKKVAN